MPEYKVTSDMVPIMKSLLSLPGWNYSRVGRVFGITPGAVRSNVLGARKTPHPEDAKHDNDSMISDIVREARVQSQKAYARVLRMAADELDPPENSLQEDSAK